VPDEGDTLVQAPAQQRPPSTGARRTSQDEYGKRIGQALVTRNDAGRKRDHADPSPVAGASGSHLDRTLIIIGGGAHRPESGPLIKGDGQSRLLEARYLTKARGPRDGTISRAR